MTRKIDDKRALVFVKQFPFRKNKNHKKRNTSLVGIGSNVGNSIRIFQRLFCYLQQHKNIEILKTSPLYKNPPFGLLEQRDFLNGLILVRTTFKAKEFMKFLLHTEKIFGRKRTVANGPRTLDLDIIFFEKLFVYNKELMIPHPKWQERDSVIVPMIYINSRFLTI